MNRSIQTNLIKTGVCAAAMLFLAPAQLAAQDASCNASLNVTSPTPLAILNEPITIDVEIGAGTIDDDVNDPAYLDISQFEYQMDCSQFDDFPNCTDPGNTVVFDGINSTTCTDENAAAIVFDTNVVGENVTFTPADPSTVIRVNEDESCTVSFDIVVTGVAPENDGTVYELTGWLSSTEPSQGICSNGAVASAAANVAITLDTTSTVFWVTKDFTDDNPDPVDVHIRCNTGLPLEQSFTLVEGGTVGFTVLSYAQGELDCDVWEEPVPDGYTPDYVAGATTGIGNFDDDEEGCHFTNVVNGQFTCDVTNAADPGMFTVNKQWVLDEEGAGLIDQNVDVTISCNSEILTQGATFDDQTNYWVLTGTIGDGGSLTAEVDTEAGAASCMATEVVSETWVLSTGDCGWQPVPAASDVQCTFVNTAFFEGIPTLSQYGMALMALLMLGIGMVGFRRFA